MTIRKIDHFNITCSRCGCKIELSLDEYLRYLKTTEYYGLGEVICMSKVPNEENEIDTTRVNLPCPCCDSYIALNFDAIDSDRYGFNLPYGIEAIYKQPEELAIEKYITNKYDIPEDEQARVEE